MSFPASRQTMSPSLTFATFRSTPETTRDQTVPMLPIDADVSLTSYFAPTEMPPSPQTAYIVHDDGSRFDTATASFVERRRDETDGFGIHVNFAWRSVDVVNYPRADISRTFTVVALNPQPGDAPWPCPGSHLLLTRATSKAPCGDDSIVKRCADFDLKGCCRRGPRCAFAHVVTIGETGGADKRRVHRPKGRAATAAHLTTATAPVAMTTAPVASPSASTKCGWWYRNPYSMSIVRCGSIGTM